MNRRSLPILVILIILLTLMIGGCSEKTIPVERIAITSLPKLEYLKGETFDLNNAKVTAYYADGRNETFPLTFSMISDYDPQEVGEHILSIRYENAKSNVKINISNAPIVGVEAIQGQAPYKVSYIESQSLDITNLKLQINYESGEPDIVTVTEDMVTGFDPEVIGRQEVTIKYLNKYTTTFTVNIRKKAVSSISIAEIPDKKLYLINEKITFTSLAKGRLFIAYDNGFTEYKNFEDLYATQEELDAALDYQTRQPSSKEIVELHYENKTVIFNIKVLEKEAESFEILRMPTELQIVGTSLSLRGGQLSINYNNKTNEVVNMTDEKVSSSGYDKTRIGMQTIVLAFTDIRSTFSFQIEVIETKPIELQILLPVTEQNSIIKYSQATTEEKIYADFYEEGTIDLSLWEYRLKMDNGSYSAIYTVDEGMFKGDLSELYLDKYGLKSFSFEYLRDNATLIAKKEINIIKKTLERITVAPPTNNIFYAREELSLIGATYTAYFNDGTSFTNNITRDMVSGFNNTQLGNQDVNITYATEKYGEKMNTFKVLVIRKAQNIQFESITKSIYILGENFDISGLVMRIHYEGYVQSDLFSGPFGSEWTFTNTSFNEVGNKEVNVEYQAVGLSLTATIPIIVKNDLVSIEFLKQVGENYEPVDAFPEVVVGLSLDLTSLFIKATLENGFRMVALSNNMTNYQRTNKVTGIREINITYGGMVIATSVNVIEREIASLELLSKPNKKYYKAMVPAILDIEGLSFRLSFTNNTDKLLNVNNLVEQNIDNLVYGFINEENQVEYITLSTTVLDTSLGAGIEIENKLIDVEVDGFAVNFSVIVAYKIATDISWDISDEGEPEVPQPTIITYQGIEEIYFPIGASFKVIYNDGEFSEIIIINDVLDIVEIIGFNYNISGFQVINIKYQDISLSTIIEVKAKDLLSIEFIPDFYVPDVTEGLALDLRQAKIIVTYYHNMNTGDPADNIILPPTTMSLSAGMIDYNKNSNTLGTRAVIVTYSYKGNTTEVRNLYFNITVREKQLVRIGMGVIPQTKYIELDQYKYEGGTIIVYYNNDTTATLSLADAKRVRDASQILPTDVYVLNYGQFDNADFSGFSRKQQIFIKYREGNISSQTSYDIIMHDRLNAEVVFAQSEDFNIPYNTYYYWYGEDRDIQYQIKGYAAHTDQIELLTLIDMELEKGINYTFKYINDITGEEFAEWPRDAGTYTIHIQYNADAPINNDRIHNSFVQNERKVVIRPKNIHIEPDDLTKVYGEKNPTFTSVISAVEYRELADGAIETIYHTENVFGYNENASTLGTISYTYLDNSNVQVWEKSAIGTYTINVSIANHRNYNVTYGVADFVVTKRAITIIADSKTKEYGQSDPAFTYTTAAVIGNDKSGLIQGDTFSGSLLRANASASNGVGTYAILIGGLTNNNYEISYIMNNLTITKRRLVLTVNDYTKVYGQGMPIFQVEASSDRATPFAYTDTMSSLIGTLSFTCLDNFGEKVKNTTDVGIYDIIPSGYSSDNYTIEYVKGSITINRRQINVAAAAKQKIYGTTVDPALTYTTHNVTGVAESGLYASDILNGSLARQAGEAAAEYGIMQGTLQNDNNPNYDISFIGNVFTITKRAAQIEITKTSRQYNGELPSLAQEDYVLHNASGDIKGNISITFINPSKNVGTYSISFVNSDTNHTLTFYSSSGYLFTITQKEVTTVFYNIPYGSLENDEYTGSTFKGSSFHYEARVASGDICVGDSVDVVIHTAEIIAGVSELAYMERNSVLNVGRYSIKVVSLTNYNYKLRTQSVEDIAMNGNYKITEFSIIPAIIKVYVKTYSRPYSGGNVVFSNSLTLVGGFYESLDYRLITALDFIPQGLNVYPYYINANGLERPPSFVEYRKDEAGEYLKDEFNNFIIDGYSMKAVTGNKNYIAVLVDNTGAVLERDEHDEIENKSYRFKITPQIIDVDLLLAGVTKEYNALPPNIPSDKFNLKNAQVNKETEVYFEFVRKDIVPDFMQDYIQDKDCGIFTIMPFTSNMNYTLRLSDNKQYDYEIKKVLLYSCDLGGLTKQYDGLKPKVLNQALNFSNYNQNYTLIERDQINIFLNFGTQTDFGVGSYPFTVEFLFPYANPQKHAGYEDYLDYNHQFVDISWLSKVYTIQRRNVKIVPINTDAIEGFNWKYYNGLQGALLPDEIDRFSRGFIIVDSKAYDESYRESMNMVVNGMAPLEDGQSVKRKHMLNDTDDTLLKDEIIGNLTLEINTIMIAPVYSKVLTTQIIGNSSTNPNFLIQEDRDNSSFQFNIKLQIVYYHFDLVTRPYGETITKESYKFALAPEERAKVIESGTTESLFAADGLFPLDRFNPIAMNVNAQSPVGLYSISSNKVVFDRNYELRFDAVSSINKFEIVKRELPVSYINEREGYYTITRIYGDPVNNIIYNYGLNTGTYGVGLTSWDFASGLTSSIGFDMPNTTLISGIGDNIYTDVGIINSPALTIDFGYVGTNTNYVFTYDNFKREGVLTQPKLEIIKAKLIVKVAKAGYNGTNDASLIAVYGQPPTYGEDYEFYYSGLKLDQTPQTVAVNNLNTFYLSAVDVVIGGQTVSFAATTIDLDMSSSSLESIIGVNLSLDVNWNSLTNKCDPHAITASLGYRGTINRQATNGLYYDFTPTNLIPLSLKNYDFEVDDTDYTVEKRDIDVWLELLYDNTNAEDATFNILWDEVPTVITDEMILLSQYSKEQLLFKKFTASQIVTGLLNHEQILNRLESKESILILANKLEEGHSLTPTEINALYDTLTTQDFDMVFNAYGFDEDTIQLVYDTFSTEERLNAYEVFVSQAVLASIMVDEAYTQAQLLVIYEAIKNNFTDDEARLVYRYRYDESRLVYGDTISASSTSKINISNIALNYNTARGENKQIVAKGITGDNYAYNYRYSNLNIYRYVVSLGFDNNQLPNIMVAGSDEFSVRVNYVDGSFEYLSFNDPQATDYLKHVDYTCGFVFNSPIDLNIMNTNQNIQITYTEQFFGNKVFSIQSEVFQTRVFRAGDDALLWGREAVLPNNYKGGTFVSSNGNKEIGEKVEANYDYYLSHKVGANIEKAEYDFDIIDVAFRLSPKAGLASYYFKLILDENTALNKSLVLQFNSGTTETLSLMAKLEGENNLFTLDMPKPGELDIFDGRTHEIQVYIDKLGTRAADDKGYSILVVIDKGYYYSFNMGKNYVPEDISSAGFESNNCFAWISRYNVYEQGLESSRAITILPSSNAFYAQSYVIRSEDADKSKKLILRDLVTDFTFTRSSYKNDSNLYSYVLKLNGVEETDLTAIKALTVGLYLLDAEIFYNGDYMDSIQILISVSLDYRQELLTDNITNKTPYMAKPVTYYGYTYVSDDMVINSTQKKTINATSTKSYRYIKEVFSLDFAKLTGGLYPDVAIPEDYEASSPTKWNYPYSAAIILKTTNTNADLRDPTITGTNFNGIGLYIRYDGTTYFTKVFIRINTNMYYSIDYTNIEWSGSQRTIVEALFDENTGEITIIVRNDEGSHTLLFGNGSNMQSGQTLTTYELLPIITHANATSSISLYNTKIKIFQMESGFKNIQTNNYHNAKNGEFVSNTEVTSFTTGDKIFMDNGLGYAQASNFKNYDIKFSTTFDNEAFYNDDFFRFIIGANKPSFENTSQGNNRGLYIGYQKIESYYALHLSFYKRGTVYANQFIAATKEGLGLTVISNIIDGAEHTISVRIGKTPISITDPDNGLFSCSVENPMSVYQVRIYYDGNDLGTCLIPVENDLSRWYTAGGSASDPLTYGKFLPSNMYPGIEIREANMKISSFTVY